LSQRSLSGSWYFWLRALGAVMGTVDGLGHLGSTLSESLLGLAQRARALEEEVKRLSGENDLVRAQLETALEVDCGSLDRWAREVEFDTSSESQPNKQISSLLKLPEHPFDMKQEPAEDFGNARPSGQMSGSRNARKQVVSPEYPLRRQMPGTSAGGKTEQNARKQVVSPVNPLSRQGSCTSLGGKAEQNAGKQVVPPVYPLSRQVSGTSLGGKAEQNARKQVVSPVYPLSRQGSGTSAGCTTEHDAGTDGTGNEHDTGDFQLNSNWESSAMGRGRFSTLASSSCNSLESTGEMAQLMKTINAGPRFMLAPNSVKRWLWSILGLTTMMCDLVSIPMVVVEMVPVGTGIKVGWWISRLYWSVDIPCSFRTGFVDSAGLVEMQPKVVAKHYMKTWFPVDILLVLFDWCELAISSVIHAGEVGDDELRLLLMLRMVRLARLMRLAKMPEVFETFVAFVRSESLVVLMRIGKLMILIILVAHIVACAWFYIGSERAGTLSWRGTERFANESVVHLYATSLHWALIQLKAGGGDVYARSEGERIFSVVVILGAFIMAASFVSSITSAMTKLHIIAGRQSQQFSILRKYLNDNGISNELAIRVRQSAKHLLMEQERNTTEDQVELLELLSDPLRAELHFEGFAPTLCLHPLFQYISEHYPRTMRSICHTAISVVKSTTGDVLFSDGDLPQQDFGIIFVKHGSLEYIQSGMPPVTLQARDYCCEAALWVNWVHRGVLITNSNTCLLAVQVPNFCKALQGKGVNDLGHYATRYLNELNTLSAAGVSDLPGGLPDPNPLVGSLEQSEFGPVSRRRFSGVASWARPASKTPVTVLPVTGHGA